MSSPTVSNSSTTNGTNGGAAHPSRLDGARVDGTSRKTSRLGVGVIGCGYWGPNLLRNFHSNRDCALLAVADKDHAFIISGTGDVVEPEDNILAIGSGGPYALSSARALLRHSSLSAHAIVEESMLIAGAIDIYTNQQLIIEDLKP